jgi:ribonucleoside-diphosphate reductase alpha chain
MRMTEKEKEILPRPQRVKGETILIKTGCGNAYITVSTDPTYPAEVFGILGKPGGCAIAFLTTLTRIITKARLYGMPTSKIIKQLRGTHCPNSNFSKENFIPSCPEAIARALEEITLETTTTKEGGSDTRAKASGGVGTGEESTK